MTSRTTPRIDAPCAARCQETGPVAADDPVDRRDRQRMERVVHRPDHSLGPGAAVDRSACWMPRQAVGERHLGVVVQPAEEARDGDHQEEDPDAMLKQ